MESGKLSRGKLGATPKIRSEILARMVDVPLRSPAMPLDLAPETPHASVKPASSAMDETRKHLPFLVLLPPEAVPSVTRLASAVDPAVLHKCRAALDGSAKALLAGREALKGVVPQPRPGRRMDIAAMIRADAPANYEVHDNFFNILRGAEAYPAQALKSQFQALGVLRADLAETPTTLRDEQLSGLERGLRASLAAMLDGPTPAATLLPRYEGEPQHADHVGRRWIRGHQIFAALTQGLIFAVNAFGTASATKDQPGRAVAADLIASLLDACSTSLELTGDFAPDAYEDTIRVTMAPPFQPEGFSGLLSADHRELVFRLKAERPAMERLRDEDPHRHGRIVAALAGVYDSHKHVCARFVGTDRTSLLMSSEASRSGVDQLERFKVMRLRQLGPTVGSEEAASGAAAPAPVCTSHARAPLPMGPSAASAPAIEEPVGLTARGP